MSKVYVKIRHWLFWYGHYELCSYSTNDEIVIYSDKEATNALGYFEITALKNNDRKFDCFDDIDYANLLRSFMESEKSIDYQYIYPMYEEDKERQVTHDAPRDSKGNKPSYIIMLSKDHEYWDTKSIKDCIKILDKKFLNLGISEIEILEVPTYEKAKESYEEDLGLGFKYD